MDIDFLNNKALWWDVKGRGRAVAEEKEEEGLNEGLVRDKSVFLWHEGRHFVAPLARPTSASEAG